MKCCTKYYKQYTDMRKGTDAQNLSAEFVYGWQKFYAGSTDLLLQVEKNLLKFSHICKPNHANQGSRLWELVDNNKYFLTPRIPPPSVQSNIHH